MLLQAGQLLSTSVRGSRPSRIRCSSSRSPLAGEGRHRRLRAVHAVLLFGLPAGVAADRFDRRRLMIMADVVGAASVGDARRPRADAPRALLDDPRRRVRRRDRRSRSSAPARAARSGRSCRSHSSRPPPASRRRAAADGASRRPAARRRALRCGPRAAVPRRRALVRLLDRLDPRDAHALPGGARSDAAPLRKQLARRLSLPVARPLPADDVLMIAASNFSTTGVQLAVIVLAKRQGLSSASIGAFVALVGVTTLLGLRRVAAAPPLLLAAHDPALGVLGGARLRAASSSGRTSTCSRSHSQRRRSASRTPTPPSRRTGTR